MISHSELTPKSILRDDVPVCVLGDDVSSGPHPKILVLGMISHRELIFGGSIPQGAHFWGQYPTGSSSKGGTLAQGITVELGQDGLEAKPKHTPAKPGSISGSKNIGQEQFKTSNSELKREEE